MMLSRRRGRKEKQRQNFSVQLTISSCQGWRWCQILCVPTGTELRSQIETNVQWWHKPIASELVFELEHQWGAGREVGGSGEWQIIYGKGLQKSSVPIQDNGSYWGLRMLLPIWSRKHKLPDLVYEEYPSVWHWPLKQIEYCSVLMLHSSPGDNGSQGPWTNNISFRGALNCSETLIRTLPVPALFCPTGTLLCPS